MSDRPPPSAASPDAGRRGPKILRWSTNALAGIGLFGIIGIVAIALLAFGDIFADRNEPPRVAAKHDEASFVVHSAADLAGTNLVQMTVSTSTGEENPYGSRGSDDVRNVLLVDKASGASRMLMPDNQHRIAEIRFLSAKGELVQSGADEVLLPKPGEQQPQAPVAYYLLQVEAERSEGREQGFDVILGRIADWRQDRVMRSIDGIDALWMQSPTRVGMLVREKLALYYRIVDVPSLKVVSSRRIEIG